MPGKHPEAFVTVILLYTKQLFYEFPTQRTVEPSTAQTNKCIHAYTALTMHFHKEIKVLEVLFYIVLY